MHEVLDRLLIRKHRGCFLKYLSLIYEIEIKTIVEIGVFRGKNAEVLRQEFPEAHLYLIDPWTPDSSYLTSGSAVSEDQVIYHKAKERTYRLFENDPHVTILEKPSLEAAPLVPSALDLVFIDANHAYASVKQDIVTWKPKIRPGGILSGHNYGRPRLPGVVQAVTECLPSFHLGQDEVWYSFIEEKRTEEDSNL
ncbi:MAG: class I SAM-dependent methyltransferase [Chlamydiia bacterium]|nr:class I SAM-dependent methyltransferase [Chlamydiia bacterium]